MRFEKFNWIAVNNQYGYFESKGTVILLENWNDFQNYCTYKDNVTELIFYDTMVSFPEATESLTGTVHCSLIFPLFLRITFNTLNLCF